MADVEVRTRADVIADLYEQNILAKRMMCVNVAYAGVHDCINDLLTQLEDSE